MSITLTFTVDDTYKAGMLLAAYDAIEEDNELHQLGAFTSHIGELLDAIRDTIGSYLTADTELAQVLANRGYPGRAFHLLWMDAAGVLPASDRHIVNEMWSKAALKYREPDDWMRGEDDA